MAARGTRTRSDCRPWRRRWRACRPAPSLQGRPARPGARARSAPAQAASTTSFGRDPEVLAGARPSTPRVTPMCCRRAVPGRLSDDLGRAGATCGRRSGRARASRARSRRRRGRDPHGRAARARPRRRCGPSRRAPAARPVRARVPASARMPRAGRRPRDRHRAPGARARRRPSRRPCSGASCRPARTARRRRSRSPTAGGRATAAIDNIASTTLSRSRPAAEHVRAPDRSPDRRRHTGSCSRMGRGASLCR